MASDLPCWGAPPNNLKDPNDEITALKIIIHACQLIHRDLNEAPDGSWLCKGRGAASSTKLSNYRRSVRYVFSIRKLRVYSLFLFVHKFIFSRRCISLISDPLG